MSSRCLGSRCLKAFTQRVHSTQCPGWTKGIQIGLSFKRVCTGNSVFQGIIFV
jgi:hypothetical protein